MRYQVIKEEINYFGEKIKYMDSVDAIDALSAQDIKNVVTVIKPLPKLTSNEIKSGLIEQLF